MIRLKGSDNKEANYQGDKMMQALGGGPKKKSWGQDQWLYDKSKSEAVTIKSASQREGMTEVHNIYRKMDGLLDPKAELKPYESDSDDDLFAEDDNELDRIRAARLNQLQKQGGIIQKFKNLGHGKYNHISEDQFLPTVTESKYAVVHFYHTEFERCRIVDKHLEALSMKYLPVKFAKLDAEKSPFFVDKLKIIMLPTIVLFKDGIAVDRVVGFEELGGNDDFSTKVLETRMKKKGVLRSLTREGVEIEGDEDDERERERQSKLRGGRHGVVIEDNDEFSD